MLSGTSLRQPLALAAAGAHGETARELVAVLAIPADTAKAAAAAKAETAAWQAARGKAELVIANRLWSDKALAVNEGYTSTAASAFGAGVEPVDFAHAPDVARKAVNRWVAEKTEGKIPDLLAEGAVDKRTRLVVTNAVYFKARWSAPFSKGATKNEAFKKTPARAVDVPTMHATALHGYAHVGTAKVLDLRYDASQLAMLVVLPDDAAGLAKLEESVTPETFEAWTKAASSQRVAVSLPRFAFTWGGPLEAALKELGITTAFGGKADFAGIAEPAGGERLQLSRVVQKTWVSVDEEGTEAAAASGITMSVTSAHTGPVAEFKADHPFLFFVYDAKRGAILFAGRVSDPKP
jgi:serpin B